MKLFSLPLLFYLLCSLTPVTCLAGEASTITPRDSVKTMASAKILLSRLDEINAMDRTIMNAADLKKLKKESRRIKANLKDLDGGAHIPVGSLVVLLLVPLVIFNLTE